MLETWLKESKIRLPALVMLETWLWAPSQKLFLISSGNLYRIITLPFARLTTP